MLLQNVGTNLSIYSGVTSQNVKFMRFIKVGTNVWDYSPTYLSVILVSALIHNSAMLPKNAA